MKIIKEKINFTQVSNINLEDPLLSWKAKGLYAYLWSRPENWDFSVPRITTNSTDGEKSTASGIKELEAKGYLERKREKNGKVSYYLYQTSLKVDLTPKTANSQKGKQPKQPTAKIGTISNKEKNSNTKESNNTDLSITTNVVIEDLSSSSSTDISKKEEKLNKDLELLRKAEELIAVIKKATEIIHMPYKKGKFEIARAKDLIRDSDGYYKKILENSKQKDFLVFVDTVVQLTSKSKFWYGKINNAERFFYNAPNFINELLAKKTGYKWLGSSKGGSNFKIVLIFNLRYGKTSKQRRYYS